MCGIVCVLHKDMTTPELPVIKKMADRIHHRGPDSEGHFIHKNVALYHKRLSIIDIDGGAQPMIRGHLSLIFNGEIYNYLELKEDLKKKG